MDLSYYQNRRKISLIKCMVHLLVGVWQTIFKNKLVIGGDDFYMCKTNSIENN